jgi:hypothetical protein
MRSALRGRSATVASWPRQRCLTRAWALYKLERVDQAAQAFNDFATRYPNRFESDEARLMAAQAQLELGRSVDAERVFQRVADSSAAGIALLQAQTNAAIAELSRALVTSRSVETLVLGDPNAKVLALRDSSTAGDLLAVGATSPTTLPGGGPIAVLAAPDAARIDSIAARAPTTVRRVLFTPASRRNSSAMSRCARRTSSPLMRRSASPVTA